MTFLISRLAKMWQFSQSLRTQRWVKFLMCFLAGLLIFQLIFEYFTVEIPVFGFHDIIDVNNPQERPPFRQVFTTDYTQQDFEVFLDGLLKENYWLMTTTEVYDYYLAKDKKPIPREHEGQNRVMITFDDGYESINTRVLPILQKLEKKYNQTPKIVLFINPAFLGKQGVYLSKMTCQELREGFERGYYDVQSHGLNHERLTEISPKALQRELGESQKQLKKCMKGLEQNGMVAEHIAYPFGQVNLRMIPDISRYYLSGYLYNSKTLKIWWGTNRYYLPRLTANAQQKPQRLLRLASGGWF